MEIPDIRIESIPTIKIIDIPPSQALRFPAPSILLPGCYKQHRDARPTNTQIIEDDPTGSYWVCSNGPLPTIKAPEYNPAKIVYSNDKEEEKEVFVPCPGPKNQKMGDFRNDKRLERVIGWELSDDGSECITLYESVKFIDTYFPSLPTAVSTASIALVAASAPLLLNVIKPAVKNIVKKLTAKKKK
tara:strand:- start:1527 stop:2087 length:561 start_codon:yes stop_codon:yes gene_type:complete